MKILLAHIDCIPVFKVGDPMPDGYLARQDWAAVHIKAGIKQESCASCCLYLFPHQMSKKVHTTKAIQETRSGRRKHFKNVTLKHRYCLECEAKRKEGK